MKFVKTLMAAALLTTAIASSTVMATGFTEDAQTDGTSGDKYAKLATNYKVDIGKKTWDLDNDVAEKVLSGEFKPGLFGKGDDANKEKIKRVKSLMHAIAQKADATAKADLSAKGLIDALRTYGKSIKVSLTGLNAGSADFDDLSSGAPLQIINDANDAILEELTKSGKFASAEEAELKKQIPLIEAAQKFLDSDPEVGSKKLSVVLSEAQAAAGDKTSDAKAKQAKAKDLLAEIEAFKLADLVAGVKAPLNDFVGLDLADATSVKKGHTALAKARQDLVDRLDDASRKHADLDKRHGELNTKYTDLDKRHGELDTKHGELNTKHTKLDSEHTRLRAEADKLAAVVGKVKSSKLFSSADLSDDVNAGKVLTALEIQFDDLTSKAAAPKEDPTQKKLLEAINSLSVDLGFDPVSKESEVQAAADRINAIFGEVAALETRLAAAEKKAKPATTTVDMHKYVEVSKYQSALDRIKELEGKVATASKTVDSGLPPFGGTTNTGTTTSTSADHRSASPVSDHQSSGKLSEQEYQKYEKMGNSELAAAVGITFDDDEDNFITSNGRVSRHQVLEHLKTQVKK